MLKLDGICKTFRLPNNRAVIALDNVTLQLDAGDFAVIIGANGSGKSTLFDLIAGKTYATYGKVSIKDVDITRMAPHHRSKYITLISQSRDAGLPRAMTVEEVLQLALERRGIKSQQRFISDITQKLDRLEPGLSKIIGTQVWNLSGGEYQLVALTVADAICEGHEDGHLLLLDEHVSQLAPAARDRVVTATCELVRNKGITTMISTHSPSVATSIGNRQIILSEGRIYRDIKGNDIIRDPVILRGLLVGIASREEQPQQLK